MSAWIGRSKGLEGSALVSALGFVKSASEHWQKESTFQARSPPLVSIRSFTHSWPLAELCELSVSSTVPATASNSRLWEEGIPRKATHSIHSPPRAASVWCCRGSGRSSTPRSLGPACSLLYIWSASRTPVSPTDCWLHCSSEKYVKHWRWVTLSALWINFKKRQRVPLSEIKCFWWLTLSAHNMFL